MIASFSASRLALVFSSLALCLSGCNKKKTTSQTPTAQSAASSAPRPTAVKAKPAAVRKAVTFSIPVGPKLGVFPGQGVGPIRFGATIKTIERLMEAPCTEKSATLCRYAAHAIDFYLKDGVLVKIQVQGDERPFDDEDHTYGIFNGQFPQGAALGMFPQYVINMLGEPLRKEKISAEANAAGGKNTQAPQPKALRERHFYKGAVVEYDELKNGNVVLAAIILEKP